MATEDPTNEDESGLPPGYWSRYEEAKRLKSGGAAKERTFDQFLAEQGALTEQGAGGEERTFDQFLAEQGTEGGEAAPIDEYTPRIPPDPSTLAITMREGLGAGAWDLLAKGGSLLGGLAEGMIVDPIRGLVSLPQAVGAIPEKLSQVAEQNPFQFEKAKASLLKEGYSEKAASYLAGLVESVGSPFYYGEKALSGVTSMIPGFDLVRKNKEEKQQYLQDLATARERGAITDEQFKEGLDYADISGLEWLTLPGTPEEYYEIAREAGGVVGPAASLKGIKGAGKLTGKALESEKLKKIANIGQNRKLKEQTLAATEGGSVVPLKVLSRTTDAEKQIFYDALKFEDRYLDQANKIFKDVPSSPKDWRESPKLFERILGSTKKTGEKVPGAFRKYIDEFKGEKKTISDKVDEVLDRGLAVSDINIGRLNSLIDTYKKNSFTQEALGLAESGLEKFEADFLKSLILDKNGRPLRKGFSGLTMAEANKYIGQIDDELRKIGYYDDKTYRSIISDPSATARVLAEGESLRAIRQTLQDAQQKALTNPAVVEAVGADALDRFKEANANISMAIEYENIWRRFMPQTLEQVVKPTGSSLNTSVRLGKNVKTGNFATRNIGDLGEGEGLSAALKEQREAVELTKNIAKYRTGQLPPVEPRKFPRLTGIDTTLTPGQRQAAVIGIPLTSMMTAPELAAPMTPISPVDLAPDAPEASEQSTMASLIEALGFGQGAAPAATMTPATTTTTTTMPETTTTTMPPTTTTMGGAPELTMPTEEEGFEAPEAPMGAAAAAAVMPQMPEGPMQLPTDTGLFTAPPKPFTPIKP